MIDRVPERFDSIPGAHDLAALILESVPRPLAVFSDRGSLVLANRRFIQAIGVEPRPGESRSSILLRAFGRESTSGEEVRRNDEVFHCRVEMVSSGASILWLDPEQQDSRGGRRSVFLSIASHDIRAPLANTRSYASLLLSPKMELNERARHCVEVIRRNADRALGLLQEFVDACLDEIGALDLDSSMEDVLPVIRECVERARAAADEKGVQISAELPTALPPASIDRARFAHAVGAYLAQGVARASGGQVVHLEVQAPPGELYVSVSDSAETEPGSERTLFDREERAIAEGRLGEGFRLGLAKAEIEAHGGRVGAHVRADGATLFFTLPVKQC